ncbi:MAG TPA: hypothetical protein VK308_05685 [Pyrinomonadaceae bacterium]|nr:hypothetical protein [Pyrinomonadaceae bacterium]
MKKTIRNLFLVSCFFFAVSYDSCTLGIGYDKKYKLSPEVDNYSCIMATVYGKRWERFGFVTFGIGTSFLLSAFITYRRKRESKNINTLNLVEE